MPRCVHVVKNYSLSHVVTLIVTQASATNSQAKFFVPLQEQLPYSQHSSSSRSRNSYTRFYIIRIICMGKAVALGIVRLYMH